ncbi:MAG: isoprenylcysteine carboxylmethyltransferase family protein [Candidatus Aminicenantes bacterium]|nr:isoprenylcysteine carboxylmethyltransferase family protein [Candidatus Aminicenantes bacterium]
MSANSAARRPLSPLVKVALSLAFVALVFIAAGTVRWTAFWVLLGFYVVTTGGWLLWLKRRDPGLLKERMTGAARPDVKRWDRTIIRVYTVLLSVMLIVAAMDAVRFRWSHVPRVAQGLALLVLFAAWSLVIWAFRVNAFLAEVVRIQTDRGHAVCTTGPYRIVRHPMYAAVILTILGVPVLLGSLYALILAGMIVVLFILRTALEDRMLQAELPGYAEYARAVRWKLVPKVW